MAQEWWSSDETVQPSKAVTVGVEIAPKPEKPEKPEETFRTMTQEEATASGLDPTGVYQISNTSGKMTRLEAPNKAAKVLREGDAQKLTDDVMQVDALSRALNSFQDDFGGNLLGTVENLAQGVNSGIGTEGQRNWWADFRASDNIIRNELFGASLTEGEKSAYMATTVSPSMDPKIIRENLNKRLKIIQGAAQRRYNRLNAAGYNKEEVDAIVGEVPIIPKPVPATAETPPAPGGGAGGSIAPIEAGKAFQTEADLDAQRQMQAAWNRGASVDEIIQINSQFGRGPLSPADIEWLRANPGKPRSFYATPSGQPTAAEGLIGAALSTPVGEAVGGYTVGAANALTAGTLDELAPILGLDPGRVQAAKDYLRERAPVASFAGEVTGGILGTIPAVRGAGAALAGTRLAGAAPLAGEILYGAGYGAGEAPEGQRVRGALIGATAAAAGGTLANRFLPGGPGTFSGMTPDVPPAAVIPDVPIAPSQYIAEPPPGAPLPSAGGAIELTADDLVRFTTAEDRAMFNQAQLGYIARSRKAEQAAAQAAPVAPVAQAAPSMAPEMPPVAAAAPAPGVAAPGAPMATEEMITLAQKAVSRGPGASKARAQLAEIAKANPEAKDAADRLGLELPTDTLSDNAQLKEVVGLTRSQIGSEAKQAWNETVSAVSDRAHLAMDELDAVTDISQVSADVFDRLDKAQMGLGRQASDLRQEVTDAVDVRGRVDATGIKSWLQTRIDDLGGGKEGIAALSSEEKRLWGIVSKGQPTYALLNEQRDLIGQALEKSTGPWANTNMKRLKDIYGSLAGDQINFIEASAGKEIADKQRAANTLFKQMYDGREQMQRIFTKDLSGSLAPLMQRAITQGTKGNVQTLNTLVKIIPENMRGKVLTSALFKAAKTTDETFSFTNFANIYRDLRSNSAVYKEFAKAVGPEGDKLLTDLYAISRRLSDADKAISRTGASTQLQLLNSERLLSRILMASGGAAGAGLVASALGGPGAAVVAAGLAAAAPEIAQRVGKTNAQKLHNLMSSAEFRDLATSAATGDALDRNINRVAGSGAFRDFAKDVGIELKQGRNWLRSAITVGSVGEMRPEPGPPEGAIMMRPQ